MAAISYSPEHKARTVQTFLSRGTRFVREVSRELGISHTTLFEWVAASSFETDFEAAASTPESWQAPRRMQAIAVYDALAIEERGEFLRSDGLSSIHIEKWRQRLYSALEVRDQKKLRLEKRIRVLGARFRTKDYGLGRGCC